MESSADVENCASFFARSVSASGPHDTSLHTTGIDVSAICRDCGFLVDEHSALCLQTLDITGRLDLKAIAEYACIRNTSLRTRVVDLVKVIHTSYIDSGLRYPRYISMLPEERRQGRSCLRTFATNLV